MDLALITALVIVLGVIMYVVMDGFDLGIGILYPFAVEERHRDTMMNSIAPVWDGNQTWLVLGGTVLFAGFPAAFALVAPALYLPLVFMLFGLVFRGIAFEFRFKSERRRWLWNLAFAGGSLLATFAQGVVLGAFIHGFEIVDGRTSMGAFGWLTPFSLMTGVALIAGYALLGATWLIMKTEGVLQDWAYHAARRLLPAVLLFIAAVSLWTPFLSPHIAERWFSWPNLLYLSPVPLLTAALAFAVWRGIGRRRQAVPFLGAVGLFLLSYLGLGISLWPHVVPPTLTLWDAAARPESLAFLLVGVAITLPVILAYTANAYRVFHGKVADGEGYH